jgi:hypothetical protein
MWGNMYNNTDKFEFERIYIQKIHKIKDKEIDPDLISRQFFI